MFYHTASLFLTGGAIAVFSKNFLAFFLTWCKITDEPAAEEIAWWHTTLMYGVVGVCFAISLIIGWFTNVMTDGELAFLAAVVVGMVIWLSSAIPEFNFRKIEEAPQHTAA